MATFTISRNLAASIEKVWSIAGDFTKSPGPGIVIEIEKQGDSHTYGIGAERTITIGSVRVRERLESVNPGKAFAYKILSGAPMKNHLAMVEFIPRGSLTEIRWNVEFTPKIPGTGWIVGMVTKKAINRFIDEVEKGIQ